MKRRHPHIFEDTVGQFEKRTNEVRSATNKVIRPYRKTAFQKFPLLFTLLVAFGASATYFGFERIIMAIPWLNDRPYVILFLSIAILFLTGKLYKKLG